MSALLAAGYMHSVQTINIRQSFPLGYRVAAGAMSWLLFHTWTLDSSPNELLLHLLSKCRLDSVD